MFELRDRKQRRREVLRRLWKRLVAADRASDAEPLLAEASEIFGTLEATPWLERATAAASTRQARVPA